MERLTTEPLTIPPDAIAETLPVYETVEDAWVPLGDDYLRAAITARRLHLLGAISAAAPNGLPIEASPANMGFARY